MPLNVDKISTGSLSVNGTEINKNGGLPYKVYTALLTQNGGDNPLSIDTGLLTIGVTYMIATSFTGDDFSNVGGPKITFDDEGLGTYFIATGTTPTNWTNETEFEYNTGAPVVTVLENSLGVEPTYRYSDVGEYIVNTVISFDFNKIAFIFGNSISQVTLDIASYEGGNEMFFFTPSDNQLYNYPIEIRVYN